MKNFYMIMSASVMLCVASNVSAGGLGAAARRTSQQAYQAAKQAWAKPAQQRFYSVAEKEAADAAAKQTTEMAAKKAAAEVAAKQTAEAEAAKPKSTWSSWFGFGRSAQPAAEAVAKPSMVTRAKTATKQAGELGVATFVAYQAGKMDRDQGMIESREIATIEREKEPVGLAGILRETPEERSGRIAQQFLLRKNERAWEIKRLDQELEKNASMVQELIKVQQALLLQKDQKFQPLYDRIYALDDANKRELQELGPVPISGREKEYNNYQNKKRLYEKNRAKRNKEMDNLSLQIQSEKRHAVSPDMIKVENYFLFLQQEERILRTAKKRLDDLQVFGKYVERTKLNPEMVDALESYNQTGQIRPDLREAVIGFAEEEAKKGFLQRNVVEPIAGQTAGSYVGGAEKAVGGYLSGSKKK